MKTETGSVPEGRFEIVISGSGGQGIILGGKLLAETAAVFSNRQAVMISCFGPEVRGGSSSAELIIDSRTIDYPKIIYPDMIIAMSQQAIDRYAQQLGNHCLIIANETLITDIPKRFSNVFSAPFTEIAIKKLNTAVVANMVALGAFATISSLVSPESLRQIIKKHVPPRVLEIDQRAVDEGAGLAENMNFSFPDKSIAT